MLNQNEFLPRWGGSIFDCNYCNAEGMQWKEISPDKWMPFDILNNEIHDCAEKHIKFLSKEEVVQHLINLGFVAYSPRTVSWHTALTASNNAGTLYFLVGNLGIDFKYFDHVREIKLDDRRRLYTDGGQFIRNYYKNSEINIHELTINLASRFVTNSPIENNLLVSHGTSLRERKQQYRNSISENELYDAVSNGDGEDAYLGDGVWISANGSLHDKGR